MVSFNLLYLDSKLNENTKQNKRTLPFTRRSITIKTTHFINLHFCFNFIFRIYLCIFLWYICNFECCNHKMFTCLKFLLILLFISIIKILEKEMLQQKKKEINKKILLKNDRYFCDFIHNYYCIHYIQKINKKEIKWMIKLLIQQHKTYIHTYIYRLRKKNIYV